MNSRYTIYTRTVLVLFLSLILVYPALAEQPVVVGWSVNKTTATKGKYKTGITPNGDHLASVRLFVTNKNLAGKKVIVTFPQCTQEPPIGGRPLLNLNSIIENKRTAAIYPTTEQSKETGADWVGPSWRVCPNKSSFLILPGKSVDIELAVDFLIALNHGVTPQLLGKVYVVGSGKTAESRKSNAEEKSASTNETMLANGALFDPAQVDASLSIDLNYLLTDTKRTWTLADYATVYKIAEDEDAIDGDTTVEDYDSQASVLPVHEASYRRTFSAPADETYDTSHQRLTDANVAVGLSGTYTPYETDCGGEDDFGLGYAQAPTSQRPENRADGDYVISGIFSTKWTSDRALHPGLGYKVEAWSTDPGEYQLVGADYVNGDGTWTINISAATGFEGRKLRILYRSSNRYVKIQNRTGGLYYFREPLRENIANPLNVGHRWGDTRVRWAGVSEVAETAMYMWAKLDQVADISPLRAQQIDVYFPNTWNNCGNRSPWSCASAAGQIWLIQSHGLSAEIVSHELAHQLNYEMWNNKLPANPFSAHNLNTCYPAFLGMTLIEGFADFFSGWLGYGRRDVEAGGFGNGRWALRYDLESRVSPPRCITGWSNELWVSRTFWDLHDKNVDGGDNIYFSKRGAVPIIYLNNPPANNGDAWDMRNYEAIYQSIASDAHEDNVTAIFDQNRH
jgi:hypothetical protein